MTSRLLVARGVLIKDELNGFSKKRKNRLKGITYSPNHEARLKLTDSRL